jgi:zinc protease
MKMSIKKNASRMLVLATVFAASIAPPILVAQQSKPWEEIPIPPLHPFKPHQPDRIKLKNGIVVLMLEVLDFPLV